MKWHAFLAWIIAILALLLLGGGASAADALDELVAPGTKAEVLGTGYGFCEGPAADAQGRVYFSDGKKDSIHLWQSGRPVELFVGDSNDANGMMFNRKGELVVCEGAAFRVVAFDVGTRQKRVLVGAGQRQFNEPNDLAIDAQGGFYFTDPNYAHRGQKPIKKEVAYYLSPDGTLSTVSEACQNPNGVLLSADDRILYLADCRGKALYKYDVLGPGKLAHETRWLELEGSPDGMTLDAQGKLYIACGGKGVLVYTPAGKRLGAIDAQYGVPYSSNCVFGGPDFKTLLVTSRDKFLGISMKVQGLKPWPAR